MRREGFTLAETLAALLIIGLAMGGLFQGVRMIAQVQRANTGELAANRRSRTLQTTLQSVFRAPGADDGQLGGRLRGGADAVSFPCAAEACSAKLTALGPGTWLETRIGARRATVPVAAGGRAARFRYIGSTGIYDRWPSDAAPPGERLKAVGLADGDLVLASAPIWLEQSPDCNYDLITHECRIP